MPEFDPPAAPAPKSKAPARPPPSQAFAAARAFEDRHQRQTDRDAAMIGAFSPHAGEFSDLREQLLELLEAYRERQEKLDGMYGAGA